ncbi:hypothetical protein KDW_28470 [Dictyobacter vulcani]|uniref:Uncharacterized protein n=1 Tax=Dictyobacter vulcani TaxID=2607529 RepID=A0A5J4KLF2_9CHLR|nr:hypothetical protein KDW_28470 [Dictyobacter vulcani]
MSCPFLHFPFPFMTQKRASRCGKLFLFIIVDKRSWTARRLAYATGHLQLDQAIEFNGIFHRELFGDWLDETIDDE